MDKYILIHSTSLNDLENMVNDQMQFGYYPFLPLLVRGETLIQPMILESETYTVNIGNAQATAMYEIGSNV